jgi:hypothetical protein
MSEIQIMGLIKTILVYALGFQSIPHQIIINIILDIMFQF